MRKRITFCTVFWLCLLFPFTHMDIYLGVICLSLHVLLYQLAAVFLYSFLFMFWYWCTSFAFLASMNFMFMGPCIFVYNDLHFVGIYMIIIKFDCLFHNFPPLILVQKVFRVLISFRFPHHNLVYTSSLPIRSTCPDTLTLINSLILIICGEVYKPLIVRVRRAPCYLLHVTSKCICQRPLH